MGREAGLLSPLPPLNSAELRGPRWVRFDARAGPFWSLLATDDFDVVKKSPVMDH